MTLSTIIYIVPVPPETTARYDLWPGDSICLLEAEAEETCFSFDARFAIVISR